MTEYFHILSRRNSSQRYAEILLNLSENDLVNSVVTPFEEGRPIFMDGKTVPLSSLRDVRIVKTLDTAEQALRNLAKEHRAELDRIFQEEGRRVMGSRRGAHYSELLDCGEDVTLHYLSRPPGSKATRKGFFASLQDPWVITIIGGIIVGVVLMWIGGKLPNG